MTKTIFDKLRKGRKVKIANDRGEIQEFRYVGKMNGKITFLKRISHSLGDIIELSIDKTYLEKDNTIVIPYGTGVVLYGIWHPDYETKNTLLTNK
ncbi:MAG: hypothetical protein AABX16_02465 [Nanoarchaeota archaeon]